MVALDASALLALIRGEPGHERVAARLSGACISTVNLCEVAGRARLGGETSAAIAARFASMPLSIVEFSAQQALRAADLLVATRPLGLSLGDRACLALALERGIPALTADRAWKNLPLGVAVEFVR